MRIILVRKFILDSINYYLDEVNTSEILSAVEKADIYNLVFYILNHFGITIVDTK